MPFVYPPSKTLTDLKKSGATAREVSTHCEAEGWEKLAANKKIKSLAVVSLTDDRVAMVGRLRSLETLELSGCLAKDLTPLGDLVRLQFLKIQGATTIKDFSFLRRLRQLKNLEFRNVNKFKDAGPLKNLSRLRSVKISQLLSSVKLPSLASFGQLKQLHVLEVGTRVADGSLAPLAKLSFLKGLYVPLTYDLKEYARLAIALPRVKCQYFNQPYRFSHSDFLKCRRCGGTGRITLARNHRALCPRCDREKFFAYVKHYEEMRQKLQPTKTYSPKIDHEGLLQKAFNRARSKHGYCLVEQIEI